jgi:hypothetical protein
LSIIIITVLSVVMLSRPPPALPSCLLLVGTVTVSYGLYSVQPQLCCWACLSIYIININSADEPLNLILHNEDSENLFQMIEV